MHEKEFLKSRAYISGLVAIPISGLSCVPFLFVPFFGWYRLLLFCITWLFVVRQLSPIVSRMVVEDQRFDPTFINGTRVMITRFPFDFELAELMDNKFGYYEFMADVVGNIVDTDGVFVWVDTGEGYVPSHINCLQPLAENVLYCSFDEELIGAHAHASDDED